jgi:hypothetical protein
MVKKLMFLLPASGLVVGVLDVTRQAVAFEGSWPVQAQLGTLARNLALVHI